MRKISLTLLSLFVFINVSYAATYYVSSSNGNDSNPGTSNSPWEYCPGMAGWTGLATLSAGDVVFFNNADTWIASSGNAILQVEGGVTYIGDSWGPGTRAIFRAMGDLRRSVINFMEDHATYETVVQGFEVDGNDYYTSGIAIYYPNYTIGVALNRAVKRIENCVVHNIDSVAASGQYAYGIIIRGDNGTSYVENVEILDTVVYNISRGAINLYPHTNNSNDRIGNITIRGCETYSSADGSDPGYNAGQGLLIKGNVYNLVAEYNHFHGSNGSTGVGVLLAAAEGHTTGPSNITIRYNLVNNTSGDNIQITNSASMSADFYGNVIWGSGYDTAVKITPSLAGTQSLKFYNNTFFDDNVRIWSNSATYSALEFKNNIFYETDATPLTDDEGEITSHNNNIYYRSGDGILVSLRGNLYTSSNLTSYEASALSSEPAFNNTSNLPSGFTGTYGVNLSTNTEGLNISASSPTKDGGVSLGDTYNGSINSVVRPDGNAWDIGAYEHDTTDTTPPSPPSNFRIME